MQPAVAGRECAGSSQIASVDSCLSDSVREFADAFRATGHEDSAATWSYHGLQGEAYDPRTCHMAMRIDWILYRDPEGKMEATGYQRLEHGEPPIYPSDHYPILAELTLA